MNWPPPGRRDEAAIAQVLAFRAERAIRHFTELAHGGATRLCPICSYEGPFAPVRHKPSIWCPQCDSRPRHRLLKLWMEREMSLPDGAEVLHFAPEPWVREALTARGAHCRTADLNAGFDLQLDITAIALPDTSCDMVLANHVLEHVDDAKALKELHRILRPGGQVVLTVPVIEGWEATYENPEIVTDADRALHYGDPTHLRFYGGDIRDRIRAAGFDLRMFVAEEPDVSRHGLQRGERIFVGVKP